MTIPISQFYVFIVDGRVNLYQNFEEALNEACEIVGSTEFIDVDPDEIFDMKLYFPEKARTIIISRKLFTYDSTLPLAKPDYSRHKPTYDFKKLN